MKPSPPNSAPKLWNSCAAKNKVLESWGRAKNLLLDRFFPSSPNCPAIATGDSEARSEQLHGQRMLPFYLKICAVDLIYTLYRNYCGIMTYLHNFRIICTK